MGYFNRIFCKSKEIPDIKMIMDFVNSDFKEAFTNQLNKDLESQSWNEFELYYHKDKSPIIVEINRVESSRNLAKEEIEEFKEFIGKPKLFETKKRKVIRHLNNTNFIICNQLLSDLDDEGEQVNWSLLRFFERNYEGIIQVDGQGIFIDEKYLIKI